MAQDNSSNTASTTSGSSSSTAPASTSASTPSSSASARPANVTPIGNAKPAASKAPKAKSAKPKAARKPAAKRTAAAKPAAKRVAKAVTKPARTAAKTVRAVSRTNKTAVRKSTATAKRAATQTLKAAQSTAKTATRAASSATQSMFGKMPSPQNFAFSFPSLPTSNLSNPFQSKMEDMMSKSQVNFEQFAQQAAEQGQQGVEALVKSASIWTKGCEDLMKTCMTFAQDASERNTTAFKTLLGCKTLNELTETQNQLAQQAYDDLVSSATRLSEISAKVATDTMQPLNDQVSKAIKKATSLAA